MDPKVVVNFPCCKCEAPIQLNAAFSHLSEHTKAELGLPVFKGQRFEIPSDVDLSTAQIDRIVSSFTLSNSADSDSLMMHSHSFIGTEHFKADTSKFGYTVFGYPSETVEKTPALNVTSELLDLASTNSTVDHPLCEECTDSLLQQVETQLQFTSEKAKSYEKLLKELEQLPIPDVERLELQLKDLQIEESALEAELRQLIDEQMELEKELKEKQEQEAELNEENENFQQEYCKQRILWLDAEEERVSLHNQKVFSQQQLDKLKQTNILNITFHIWKDDHIPTINNFRLGRLPTVQVPWPEISAALGQLTLLLLSLARRFNFAFSKYKVVAYGAHSYVQCLDTEGRVLPLHTMSSLKNMFDHSFDLALVAFLECFVELVQYLERLSGTSLDLPYPIVKAHLEDKQSNQKYSVKTQFNPDEQWTKAMKLLLTDFKWVITWVSSPALSCTTDRGVRSIVAASGDAPTSL